MSSLEEERKLRLESEALIAPLVARELLPNGAYIPIRGMYSIGWKEWETLPAADFVKSLRKFDDELVRGEEDWIYYLAPIIAKGELSRAQLKEYARLYFMSVDGFANTISSNAPANFKNREVRDLVYRHTSEEAGHAELLADFCVNSFGLDRVRDLWEAADARPSWMVPRKVANGLEHHAELAYAMIPFTERTLPKQNGILTDALSKVYRFPAHQLSFFYLHKYIDIYHERIALWILGKYATQKPLQEMVMDALAQRRVNLATKNRRLYEEILKAN